MECDYKDCLNYDEDAENNCVFLEDISGVCQTYEIHHKLKLQEKDKEIKELEEIIKEQQKKNDNLFEIPIVYSKLKRAILNLNSDMHTTSNRPCGTCEDLTKVLGVDFGCVVTRKRYEKRVAKEKAERESKNKENKND